MTVIAEEFRSVLVNDSFQREIRQVGAFSTIGGVPKSRYDSRTASGRILSWNNQHAFAFQLQFTRQVEALCCNDSWSPGGERFKQDVRQSLIPRGKHKRVSVTKVAEWILLKSGPANRCSYAQLNCLAAELREEWPIPENRKRRAREFPQDRRHCCQQYVKPFLAAQTPRSH